MNIMDDHNTREMIKLHEGYRASLYRCTKNVLTGGYGHAFLDGSSLPGHIWDAIFDYDFSQASMDYVQLGITLDQVRRAALIDMLFQLGLTKVRKFTCMLAALRAHDWTRAQAECLDSQYAKDAPVRAREISKMLLTGEYQGVSVGQNETAMGLPPIWTQLSEIQAAINSKRFTVPAMITWLEQKGYRVKDPTN